MRWLVETWRIGLMGTASSESNVLLCLTALESVLNRQGANLSTGAGLAAAEQLFGR